MLAYRLRHELVIPDLPQPCSAVVVLLLLRIREQQHAQLAVLAFGGGWAPNQRALHALPLHFGIQHIAAVQLALCRVVWVDIECLGGEGDERG